eukprot:CAMPEP_0204841246 /NCGR_PEP_ID=MMETSP1346-20131115/41342_1 /ASSEMBLY_ACC=CAM_ASM_000771 /TAXON_ID=215587 /ORGANISM="Aplanochytrium stocchinoi, Strain GSBS06" /LENGTH=370 /DNA_ID=CAMNT_0051979269 /DNA_START=51 /DNA_END=1163 /DNA_ORIENTATION=-
MSESCSICLKKGWGWFKAEFSCTNLNFNKDITADVGTVHGQDVYTLNWRKNFGYDPGRCIKSFPVFFGIRVVCFLIIFGLWIGSMVINWLQGRWWIYLTHWGLFVEVIYWTLAVITTYMSKQENSNPNSPETEGETEQEDLPLYAKAMWLAWDIILPGSFIILALYWFAVFEPGNTVNAMGVFVHGINFLIMAFDSILSSTPYLLLHGLYLFIFGLVFVIWSYIFYASGLKDSNGNRYIYPVLDWSNPGSAAAFSAIALFFVVPLVVLIFWISVNLVNQTCNAAVPYKEDSEVEKCDDVESNTVHEKNSSSTPISKKEQESTSAQPHQKEIESPSENNRGKETEPRPAEDEPNPKEIASSNDDDVNVVVQ